MGIFKKILVWFQSLTNYQKFKYFFILVVAIGFASKKESRESSSPEKKTINTTEKPEVDPKQLSEIESYLSKSTWTCTNVESGTAPFMSGATFEFSKGTMIVSNDGQSASNSYKITGIIPNVPSGSKYSALITINNNKDMLSWIDENLMVLSWGGDKAKLRLQRK